MKLSLEQGEYSVSVEVWDNADLRGVVHVMERYLGDVMLRKAKDHYEMTLKCTAPITTNFKFTLMGKIHGRPWAVEV